MSPEKKNTSIIEQLTSGLMLTWVILLTGGVFAVIPLKLADTFPAAPLVIPWVVVAVAILLIVTLKRRSTKTEQSASDNG